MIEALQLMLSKTTNPHVAGEILRTIQGAQNNSPLMGIRYQRVFQMVLSNGAEFSKDEMQVLAAALNAEPSERKTKTLQVRLTETEYLTIEGYAVEDGKSISDWVRSKLLE